ncbi:MAG TPA: Stp1/IreP family PP2C-type Ser/Thr phosphatase [bacterium]|nr:Stp1/IreP family PP2C-type Ser/Thr phosphatase [bacterium]
MKFSCHGKTDVGRKRELNEDSFAVLDTERVFVVADGMGGHNAGEVASSIAIETIVKFSRATSEDEEMTWPYKLDPGLSLEANKLKVGIKFANRKIFRAAQGNASYSGMGTTVVAMLLLENGTLYIAHVGDSRAYCYFDGGIKQVTEDHSLVNEYIKAGQMTPEQARNFPHKNVIMRALGMKENVLVDVQERSTKRGEVYFACSDGLSDMVTEEEMVAILSEAKTLKEAADRLIDRANENGGKDNISVVLLRIDE